MCAILLLFAFVKVERHWREWNQNLVKYYIRFKALEDEGIFDRCVPPRVCVPTCLPVGGLVYGRGRGRVCACARACVLCVAQKS